MKKIFVGVLIIAVVSMGVFIYVISYSKDEIIANAHLEYEDKYLEMKEENNQLNQKISDLQKTIIALKTGEVQTISDGLNLSEALKNKDKEKASTAVIINGMKTYVNKLLKYTVDCPVDFFSPSSINEKSSIYIISNENIATPSKMSDKGVYITIERKQNMTMESIDDWVRDNQYFKQAVSTGKTKFTIDSQKAIKQVEDFTQVEGNNKGYAVVTYISKNNYFFIIAALSPNQEAYKENSEDYNSMVNSFNFID